MLAGWVEGAEQARRSRPIRACERNCNCHRSRQLGAATRRCGRAWQLRIWAAAPGRYGARRWRAIRRPAGLQDAGSPGFKGWSAPWPVSLAICRRDQLAVAGWPRGEPALRAGTLRAVPQRAGIGPAPCRTRARGGPVLLEEQLNSFNQTAWLANVRFGVAAGGVAPKMGRRVWFQFLSRQPGQPGRGGRVLRWRVSRFLWRHHCCGGLPTYPVLRWKFRPSRAAVVSGAIPRRCCGAGASSQVFASPTAPGWAAATHFRLSKHGGGRPHADAGCPFGTPRAAAGTWPSFGRW